MSTTSSEVTFELSLAGGLALFVRFFHHRCYTIFFSITMYPYLQLFSQDDITNENQIQKPYTLRRKALITRR